MNMESKYDLKVRKRQIPYFFNINYLTRIPGNAPGKGSST